MDKISQMKKIAAEIGRIELKRNNGEYVSLKELLKKKMDFRKIQMAYERETLSVKNTA